MLTPETISPPNGAYNGQYDNYYFVPDPAENFRRSNSIENLVGAQSRGTAWRFLPNHRDVKYHYGGGIISSQHRMGK